MSKKFTDEEIENLESCIYMIKDTYADELDDSDIEFSVSAMQRIKGNVDEFFEIYNKAKET